MRKPRYIRDISGEKFGKLTAIIFAARVNGRTFWLFKCDCGSKKIMKSENVVRGNTKTCGCSYGEHAKKLGEKFLLPNDEAYKNRLYRNYKKAANKRSISFFLSKNQFDIQIQMACYYCGEGPSNTIREGKKEPFKYNGIDRKDNDLGYLDSNCVPCCGTCNKMKMELSYKSFLEQVKKIAAFRFDGR